MAKGPQDRRIDTRQWVRSGRGQSLVQGVLHYCTSMSTSKLVYCVRCAAAPPA